MTKEKLQKAKMLQNHIETLTTLKYELSEVSPIKIGGSLFRINGEDVKALRETLDERIAKLEKEFDALQKGGTQRCSHTNCIMMVY